MNKDELIKQINESKLEDIDVTDLKNVGRPYYFSLDTFFSCVEQMINADEIITALHMLDHMPGWYRDNPPERAQEIKRKVFKQLMSVPDYVNDKSELKEFAEKGNLPITHQIALEHYHPRGELMLEKVSALNQKGITPHITEFGPANYWLPYGLRQVNLKFTYNAHSVQSEVMAQAKENLKDVWTEPKENQHQIFCCFEVIEHLWNPDDIYHIFARANVNPKTIMISTPKYTLFGGLKNWDERELGHIRTYTPAELYQFCTKHWPVYSWNCVDGNMMVMVGEL